MTKRDTLYSVSQIKLNKSNFKFKFKISNELFLNKSKLFNNFFFFLSKKLAEVVFAALKLYTKYLYCLC